jgi:hypothetical protein
VKYLCSTEELRLILHNLRSEEESGILGVRVKSVDIKRNTGGEGELLAIY